MMSLYMRCVPVSGGSVCSWASGEIGHSRHTGSRSHCTEWWPGSPRRHGYHRSAVNKTKLCCAVTQKSIGPWIKCKNKITNISSVYRTRSTMHMHCREWTDVTILGGLSYLPLAVRADRLDRWPTDQTSVFPHDPCPEHRGRPDTTTAVT